MKRTTKAKKQQTIQKLKKVLVKTDIFSDDVPEWLENAAKDLRSALKRAKLLKE